MMNAIQEYMRINDAIAMSDVLNWILAAVSGLILYKIVDTMQTSMERHSMLKEVEDSFSEIYNSTIALESKDADNSTLHEVTVRSVLHDDGSWREYDKSPEKRDDYKMIIKSQNFIHIRDGCNEKGENVYHNEWISTQALHEILLQCKRIEKMFKNGVVKRIDLADMWREILPLGASGRLQFFASYYGVYEAECIAYLVMQTVVSCDKYSNADAMRYFVSYYKEHEEMHTYFKENRRYRKLGDLYAQKKFFKICR